MIIAPIRVEKFSFSLSAPKEALPIGQWMIFVLSKRYSILPAFASVTALYLAGEKKLCMSALVIAILIAFTRMYLYVHYPTDILGGVAVGIISGYIGFFIAGRK